MAFQYKSLDGWIVPGVAYFRKLQEHALQMEQELAELKEQLAVSGSRALQDRAEKWSEKWQDKCIEVGELQKQIIELESQKNAELRRLELERDWLQERNESLEEKLMRYEELLFSRKSTSEQPRDMKGRFGGNQWERWKEVWGLSEQGLNSIEIADRTGLSVSTVETYLRKYSKVVGQTLS